MSRGALFRRSVGAGVGEDVGRDGAGVVLVVAAGNDRR